MAASGLSRRGRLALAAILALAVALRLAHFLAVRDQPFFAELVLDSQEYDRWAREIAAGDWLGSEVFFQAPLYPYLIASIYRAVGASPAAVYLVQIAVAVAGLWGLARAGAAMGGERVGLAAAALGAVYGPFLFYDVQLLKESTAVSVSCFLLWTLAAARGRPSPGRWLIAGLLLGVLALLRENALLLLPFLLPLAWPRGWQGSEQSGVTGGPVMDDGRGAGEPPGTVRERVTAPEVSAGPHRWRPASRLRVFARDGTALLVGLLLALAPVAWRNWRVGGEPLPTTFQGGVNFYIGNNPEADGTYRPIVPGKQVPALERREPVRLAERALGRRLSPAEVSSYWLRRGLAWAAAEPGAFLRLQLRKLGMFWSGYEWPDAVDYYYVKTLSPVLRLPLLEFSGAALLAAVGLLLARRRLGAFAPALLFALGWTLTTVAFFLFSRYRLPVVPALLVLAGVPLAEIAKLAGSRREQPAPSTAASAATEEPAVPDILREAGASSAPRARGAGRRVGLAALVLAAFALPHLAGYEPRRDLVEFNLGRLAQEGGRTAEAVAHYRAALAANPDDFLTWLNLGSLAARGGDLRAALAAFERAAALEPRADDAWSNLGGVYLALGRLAEARSALDRALALNPQSPSALQNRALLALREGDLATARRLNARALSLDPGNLAARRLRDRLAGPPHPPGFGD
jgi:tetratricopeptide (TPR) repeat protein